MSAKLQTHFTTIDRLRPDTRGHNLQVKVIEANQVSSRAGRPARIAECLVGDDTGTILLTARNEQVDVCIPGSFLSIHNAKIDMLRTSMRLAVDQSGKLEQADDTSLTPNEDNNMSLLEFELVQIPAEADIAATSTAVAAAGPVLANGH